MRRRSLSLFNKTSQTIFRDVGSWEALTQSIGDLHLEKNELIQLVAVGSNENLPELLLSKYAAPGVKHLGTTGTLSLFEYHRHFGRHEEKRIAVQFVVARPMPEPIYVLLFVAQPRYWRHGILPLIESLYPKAARPFLTQNELHELMNHLQSAIHPKRLRVLESSSKMRLVPTARKRFQSVREWTDAPLDTVFRDARERNVWFRSVLFDIATSQDEQLISTGIQAKLSKYGYFSCNGGFELFEKALIRKLVQIGAERLKFFSNRDRYSTPDRILKPLQISYETEIFKSKEQAKRLVEAMQRFKHGTCTILHANPYIHLSVVDNVDFSAADVWVLSQNQILLVPQLKASEMALKRIVNHIFEHFREGRISEFQEQQA